MRTGRPGQLAALARGIAREAARLTPKVVSLLAHHPTATLTAGAVGLVIVLIVRYAAVLLMAALAVALLVAAAQPQRANVQPKASYSSSAAQRSTNPRPGGCPIHGPPSHPQNPVPPSRTP